MKALAFVFLALSVSAVQAAGIQKDNVAKSDKVTGIVISAKLNSDLSSEYFGYFDFTLQNNSDKWIRISKVNVSFPDSGQAERMRFVTGKDFQLWQEAMRKVIAVSQANEKTAMATIAALGYGLAALSGNQTLQTVGTAAFAGAAGSYGYQQYGKWQDSLQRAKMFPENHLMGDTLTVLPGLFVDRWLLINSKDHDKSPYLTRLFVDIETVEGIKERFTLDFRKAWDPGDAKWQQSIFKRAGASNPNCPTYSGTYRPPSCD